MNDDIFGMRGVWTPAMEMTTVQMSGFMQGRKDIFNRCYERVVAGMRRNERAYLMAIAKYRDKNIELLSSLYLLDYTKFNPEDAEPLYKCTGIPEEEMESIIHDLKTFIKDNCRDLGVKPPDFVNVTAFRALLILVMRYYTERNDERGLDETCCYFAYSMFYTIYYNFWRNMKPRKETMIYVVSNMSNKYKLKQEGSIDGMLRYSVKLCATTYRKQLMDATDQDIIYIIGQIKSRLRDFMKNIKSAYVEADKRHEIISISSPQITTGEDGDDTMDVDRASVSGDVDRLAVKYSNLFFQKPVDDSIVVMMSKLNEVSRQEIGNALNTLKADPVRIPEVKDFHECIFYIYLNEPGCTMANIKSKRFLSEMNRVYKKGNSKDENVIRVKQLIDIWLKACSPLYRETNNGGTINGLRRSIYQYFIFSIIMRK